MLSIISWSSAKRSLTKQIYKRFKGLEDGLAALKGQLNQLGDLYDIQDEEDKVEKVTFSAKLAKLS